MCPGVSADNQVLLARMARSDARMARIEQFQSRVELNYRKLIVQLLQSSNTTQLELQLGEVWRDCLY